MSQKDKWIDVESDDEERDELESDIEEDEDKTISDHKEDNAENVDSDEDSEAGIFNNNTNGDNDGDNMPNIHDENYTPSTEDKLKFTSYFTSMRGSIDEVNKKLASVIDTFKSSDKAEMKYGISYYDAKNNLMILYLSQLTYYFTLKSSGKKVDNHQMIKNLIYLKTLMEKTKIIDLKLKTQIDKLIKLADKEEDIDETTKTNKDESNFKPRILNDEDEDMEIEDANEPDENIEKDKNKIKYKVKKDTMEFFETTRENKNRKKKLEKANEKIRNSEYLKKLKEDFSNNPNEINSYNTHYEKALKEVEDYENEHFQLVKIPKREQKRLRKLDRETDDIANISKEYKQINKILFNDEHEEYEQQNKFLKGKKAMNKTLNDFLKSKGGRGNKKRRLDK
jgi:hypothetical protein